MLALVDAVFWQVTMWTLMGCVAVNLFIRIQMYLGDPRRKQFVDEWFEAFERNQTTRYRAGGLDWRVRDLSMHWGTDHSTPNGH